MDPKRRGNYLRAPAKDEGAMDNATTEFRWRVARSFALVACLAGYCMAAGSLAKAQATSASQGSGSNSRLLSAEGGRAIVYAVQDYEGTYWKSRGRPHFYRYKVENTGTLTAAKAPASSVAADSARRHVTAPAIEERFPVMASASHRPPKTASERTKVVPGSPALPAPAVAAAPFEVPQSIIITPENKKRSEERRVGKECKSRW